MGEARERRKYLEGFLAGVELYAWWKDGVQYVGTTGQTLEAATREAREELARLSEEAEPTDYELRVRSYQRKPSGAEAQLEYVSMLATDRRGMHLVGTSKLAAGPTSIRLIRRQDVHPDDVEKFDYLLANWPQ